MSVSAAMLPVYSISHILRYVVHTLSVHLMSNSYFVMHISFLSFSLYFNIGFKLITSMTALGLLVYLVELRCYQAFLYKSCPF